MDEKMKISLDKLPVKRVEAIEESGVEHFPTWVFFAIFSVYATLPFDIWEIISISFVWILVFDINYNALI